jgi:hypothetical protein
MLGFGMFKAKPSASNASDMPTFKDMSLQNKMLMLSAALKGDQVGMMEVPMMVAAQKKAAEQKVLDAEFMKFMTEGGAPAPPVKIQESVKADDGSDITDGFGPQIHEIEQPNARHGPPSLRDAYPLLMRRKLAGINIKDDIDLLDKLGPNITNINGWAVDQRDPHSVGVFYGAPPTPGAKPVKDQYGNPAGWVLENGTIQAIEATEGAKAGATERARAAYDVGKDAWLPDPEHQGSFIPSTRLQTVQALGGDPRATPAATPPPGVPAATQKSASPAGGAAPANPAYSPPRAGVPAPISRPPGQLRTQSPQEEELAKKRAVAQAEREAGAPKAYSGLQAQAAATDIVLDHLNRAIPLISGGLGGSAGWNGLLKGVPQTKAKDLDALYQVIKANIGFDKLAEMRQNSPTGGALGQVSDTENKLLQAVLETLDQTQDPVQQRAALTLLRAELIKARDNRKQAYARQYNDVSPVAGKTPSAATVEDIDAILAARGVQVP